MALGFLIDVKNMVCVILDAAIPIVRILLKAEAGVLGTVIRRKHAKLKDVLSSVLCVVGGCCKEHGVLTRCCVIRRCTKSVFRKKMCYCHWVLNHCSLLRVNSQ